MKTESALLFDLSNNFEENPYNIINGYRLIDWYKSCPFAFSKRDQKNLLNLGEKVLLEGSLYYTTQH